MLRRLTGEVAVPPAVRHAIVNLGNRALTLDEYRAIEPFLRRPLTWPPTGRRSQRSKAAPEPQSRAGGILRAA